MSPMTQSAPVFAPEKISNWVDSAMLIRGNKIHKRAKLGRLHYKLPLIRI